MANYTDSQRPLINNSNPITSNPFQKSSDPNKQTIGNVTSTTGGAGYVIPSQTSRAETQKQELTRLSQEADQKAL